MVLGRIPAFDLLTSRLTRVLVWVADIQGNMDEYALSVAHGSTVRHVLSAYQLLRNGGEVVAYPLPKALTAGEIQDLPVFPGMIIEVHPERPLIGAGSGSRS